MTRQKENKASFFQAIYTMWLREMKRLLRAKSNLIGRLVMPFFLLLALGYGLQSGSGLQGMSETGGYLNFLTPGVVGMTILFTSMFTGFSVLWDQEFGFLKEITVAPVKRSISIIGRMMGGITTSLIQGLLILGAASLMGFSFNNWGGMLASLIVMVIMAAGFTGLSIVLSSMIKNMEGFFVVVQFFTFPLFVLGGTIVPISSFPSWLQTVSYLDPVTYGVDALRNFLTGTSSFSLYLDFAVLIIFATITVWIGSWLFSKKG